MSDIVHLILCCGDTLDWERLVRRVGEHWPLLLVADPDVQLRLSRAIARTSRVGCSEPAARTRARAEIGVNDERPGPDSRSADFAIQLHDRRPRMGLQQPARRLHPQGPRSVPTFGRSPRPTSGTSVARIASSLATNPRRTSRPRPSSRDRGALDLKRESRIAESRAQLRRRRESVLLRVPPARRAARSSCTARIVRRAALIGDALAKRCISLSVIGLNPRATFRFWSQHAHRIDAADRGRHRQAHRVPQRVFGSDRLLLHCLPRTETLHAQRRDPLSAQLREDALLEAP